MYACILLHMRVVNRKWRIVDSVSCVDDLGLSPTPSLMCYGPESEFLEELCEDGGLIVGIEAAGIG